MESKAYNSYVIHNLFYSFLQLLRYSIVSTPTTPTLVSSKAYISYVIL